MRRARRARPAPRIKRVKESPPVTAVTAGIAHATVIEYLRKHPASLCAHVARDLHVSTDVAGIALRELRKAGKATSAGNTRGVRWSLA